MLHLINSFIKTMSRNAWIPVIALLTLLLIAVILIQGNRSTTTTMVTPTEFPTAVINTTLVPTDVNTTPVENVIGMVTGTSTGAINISLSSQNNSGQSGTATLAEENGKVKVTINVSGGNFTNPQPAHIHLGSCPKPGEVVYPLQDVVDGKSTTTLNVTMKELKAKGALAINIHKSAEEVSIYTVCGDIR